MNFVDNPYKKTKIDFVQKTLSDSFERKRRYKKFKGVKVYKDKYTNVDLEKFKAVRQDVKNLEKDFEKLERGLTLKKSKFKPVIKVKKTVSNVSNVPKKADKQFKETEKIKNALKKQEIKKPKSKTKTRDIKKIKKLPLKKRVLPTEKDLLKKFVEENDKNLAKQNIEETLVIQKSHNKPKKSFLTRQIKSFNSSINLTARPNDLKRMTFKEVEKKFIGHLTKCGMRSKALGIWLDFLILLKRHFYNANLKLTVQDIVLRIVNILRPLIILKKRKVAGVIYQIPYFVQNATRDNATLIAIRWFIDAINQRIENKPAVRLYKEFLDVLTRQGISYKKKQEIYQTAIKNRIYVRFLFSKSRKKTRI